MRRTRTSPTGSESLQSPPIATLTLACELQQVGPSPRPRAQTHRAAAPGLADKPFALKEKPIKHLPNKVDAECRLFSGKLWLFVCLLDNELLHWSLK